MSTSALPRPSVRSYRSLIWNFAQRDLKSRFKGTALGWAWSLLLPLGTLLIFSLVFSVVFRFSPPVMGSGRAGNFTVWLFAGLVAWNLFSTTVTTAMPTLLANGPLLQKIYFPAYAPVLGSGLAIFTQSVIEMGLLLVVLVLLQNVAISWLLLPVWWLLFAIFVTSVAVLFAVLNVHYRDLAHVVAVGLQLLFYLTPLIYQIDLVPEHWHGLPLRTLIQVGPVAPFVHALRAILYDLDFPSPATWIAMMGWTGIAAGAAAITYRRFGRDVSEVA